jgi:hypothetical protein
MNSYQLPAAGEMVNFPPRVHSDVTAYPQVEMSFVQSLDSFLLNEPVTRSVCEIKFSACPKGAKN